MAVRPSCTLPGSGSPVTAQTLARSPSRWTCPTLSTRFTGPPSCGPCASTFRPSLSWVDCCYRRESTLFTGSRRERPCRPFPAIGVCSKGAPSVRSSSLWRSSLPSLRPVPPQRPCIRVASISAPFFLDDGFCAGSAPAVRCFLAALIEGFRRVGLTVNLDKTEVIPACSSTQSFGPGDFQGCSWNSTSNFKLFLELLLGPMSGARSFRVAASARLGPSCPPLAGSRTLRGHLAC